MLVGGGWGGGQPTYGKFHMFRRFFLKASLIKVKLLKKRIKMGKKRHLLKRPKMTEDA